MKTNSTDAVQVPRASLFRRLALVALLITAVSGFALFAQDNASDLLDSMLGGNDTGAQSGSATDASGQTAPTPATASGAATRAQDPSAVEIELSGEHTAILSFPANDTAFDFGGAQKSPRLENTVGLSVKTGSVSLLSMWGIDIGPGYAGNPASLGSPGWDNLVRARPLENYIAWTPSGLKMSLGWQIYSWGSADKLNPTDNINPRDYTASLIGDKIPVFSLSTVWYPVDALSVEAVYLPFAAQDIFPVDVVSILDGRLKAMTDQTNLALQAMSIPPIAYATVSASEPSLDPNSGSVGAKLNLRLPVVDLSFDYLYGFDPYFSPTISLSAAPNLAGIYYPTRISLDRARMHRFGLDAKVVAGPLALWAEGAYSVAGSWNGSDDASRKPALSYTLGTDFNWGPNKGIYTNLQYFGTVVLNYDAAQSKDYPNGQPSMADASNSATMKRFLYREMTQSLAGQSEGLSQGLSLDLKVSTPDAVLSGELAVMGQLPFDYDTTYYFRIGDLVLQPQIDIMPIDSFHIILGAQLAYAWKKDGTGTVSPDNGSVSGDRIGIETALNNVYIEFRYSWAQKISRN